MAYVPTVFRNGQAPAYDSAEELNKAQQGILDAHNMIDNKVAIGSYTGGLPEATAGSGVISLGFRPRAVFVSSNKQAFFKSASGGKSYSAFAIDGIPHYDNNGLNKMLEITNTGFTVYNNGSSWFSLNASDQTYSYMAIR